MTSKKRFPIKKKLAPGTRVMVTKSTRRKGEVGTVRKGTNPPPSSPPLTVAVIFEDNSTSWYHPSQLTLVR